MLWECQYYFLPYLVDCAVWHYYNLKITPLRKKVLWMMISILEMLRDVRSPDALNCFLHWARVGVNSLKWPLQILSFRNIFTDPKNIRRVSKILKTQDAYVTLRLKKYGSNISLHWRLLYSWVELRKQRIEYNRIELERTLKIF